MTVFIVQTSYENQWRHEDPFGDIFFPIESEGGDQGKQAQVRVCLMVELKKKKDPYDHNFSAWFSTDDLQVHPNDQAVLQVKPPE